MHTINPQSSGHRCMTEPPYSRLHDRTPLLTSPPQGDGQPLRHLDSHQQHFCYFIIRRARACVCEFRCVLRCAAAGHVVQSTRHKYCVTLGAGASTFSHWHFVNWSERGRYVWCNAAFLCQQLHGRANAGRHVLLDHSNGALVLRVIMT